MFARLNMPTRSKPTAVLRPVASATPSIPGMLTAPRITQSGATYTFTEGTYVGVESRSATYLLDGVNVAGRVSGGTFTATAADAGRLLVYRELISGTAGGIERQASIVVISKQFDATGLTISNTYTGPQIVPAYFGAASSAASQPLVLVVRDLTFPAPGNYCLFEMGANAIGAAAYMTADNELVIRAGNGAMAISSASVCGFAYPLAGIVSPGDVWDVAMEFAPGAGTAKLWIGSTFRQSATVPSFGEWAGGDDGGFLRTDASSASSSRPAGVPSTPWPATTSTLEVYINQVVPA